MQKKHENKHQLIILNNWMLAVAGLIDGVKIFLSDSPYALLALLSHNSLIIVWLLMAI